jgi:uncharacterized pyridoxal phosphate-containing UPF0001 family protein
MHIAEEETKFGLDQEELDAILNSTELQEMKNTAIVGLMGMATTIKTKSKKEFLHLKNIFEKTQKFKKIIAH